MIDLTSNSRWCRFSGILSKLQMISEFLIDKRDERMSVLKFLPTYTGPNATYFKERSEFLLQLNVIEI